MRYAHTPSGFGYTTIPMKIMLGQPRGNGQYYSPNLPKTDLDWSTATFQRHIEVDLKKAQTH